MDLESDALMIEYVHLRQERMHANVGSSQIMLAFCSQEQFVELNLPGGKPILLARTEAELTQISPPSEIYELGRGRLFSLK